MKLVICDDIYNDALNTKEITDKYFSDRNVEVDVNYEAPAKLMDDITKDCFEYDIALLDIDYRCNDFNGIYLGRLINKKYPFCIIIYITAVLDFASDVYETEHCYFVLKNNQKITLKRALDKAVNLYRHNNDRKNISIVSNGKSITIPTFDINYITREGRRTNLYCNDVVYESYISLNELLKLLPDKFSRCHTGFIVNMDYIRHIESNKINLCKDIQVPIGRIYKEKFMLHYMDYLERRV